MVMPMKVGTISASLWRMKRSIGEPEAGGAHESRRRRCRFRCLLGDVDAVEAMDAERVHHEAGDLLAHRHEDQRVGERRPRGLAP